MLGQLPSSGVGFRDVYIRKKAPVSGVFPGLLRCCYKEFGNIASIQKNIL